MPLVVLGKWIWDFWLAQDGNDYHIFYLQADRSLPKSDMRHWHVSIGHAVSRDLQNWNILPDALRPSPPADESVWDDYTTWTGSIIAHDQRWYMFYTGSCRAEKGLVQRIGVATSEDLFTWTKHDGNPLLETDPQWYEVLDTSLWHDQAWRDPFVYHNPDDGQFHMFITARVKDGTPDARGVVAHATSTDLLNWRVGPPVTAPGEFGHMEVPQLLRVGGRYYLLFSCPVEQNAAARKERLGDRVVTGTYCLAADHITGPYDYTTERVLYGDAVGSLYSGKLVQLPDQSWGFMAFRNSTVSGGLIGDIIDPLPVQFTGDGPRLINDS